jgi:hypothetical protein
MRVVRALDAQTLEVVWMSARRACGYLRAYVALAGENEGVATGAWGPALQLAAYRRQQAGDEELEVAQKQHRDALGFSSKWVQSLLHLHARPEEERRA